MSLDETFDRMHAFASALERFDEALRGSMTALTDSHSKLEGHWQDAFARDYAAAWDPLASGIERWALHEGPEYREFVSAKLRALALYLDGNR